MIEAELHSAFCWDCDNCGKENFVRAIEGNVTEPAMQADLDNIHLDLVAPAPIESLEKGSAWTPYLIQRVSLMPHQVTCSECGNTFVAKVFESYDEEIELDNSPDLSDARINGYEKHQQEIINAIAEAGGKLHQKQFDQRLNIKLWHELCREDEMQCTFKVDHIYPWIQLVQLMVVIGRIVADGESPNVVYYDAEQNHWPEIPSIVK